MEVWVLDKDFEQIMLIDSFESLIWTDRYGEYGDFELTTAMTEDYVSIERGMYVWMRESEHMMIINDLVVKSDILNGATFTMRGYSLESILANRVIIDTQRMPKGSLQTNLRNLINECIISPKNSKRKINNFIFEDSDDPEVANAQIHNLQVYGENLYSITKDLCYELDLGFKVVYDFSRKKFVFSLYKGKDRTYDQTKNSFVVFSPSYENLLSSEYESKDREAVNVAIITGESMFGKTSGEPVVKQTKSKTGSKSSSGPWTTTNETTIIIDYASENRQIKKVVETVVKADFSEENNPETFNKTTTTTKEYDGSNVLYSTKVVVDEHTTNKVEQKNGSGDVIKTTTDKTSIHHETLDDPDETAERKKTTVSHTVADGSGFITSENETVTTDIDTKTSKSISYIVETDCDKTGLYRREMHYDGSSVSATDNNKRLMTKAEYEQALKAKAQVEVDKNKEDTNYRGETDPVALYVLNEDYWIGDVVQIENEYGKQSKSRISEIIFSQSPDKITTMPKFTKV